MKINKSSWHYRFIAGSGDIHPTNLCPYVRRLAFNLFMFGLMWAAFLGSVGVVLFLTGSALAGYAAWITHDLETWHKIMLVCGTTAGVGFAHAAAWDMSPDYRTWWRLQMAKIPSRKVRYRKAKPPGIIREYFNAKHDKLCPQLEFESS